MQLNYGVMAIYISIGINISPLVITVSAEMIMRLVEVPKYLKYDGL